MVKRWVIFALLIVVLAGFSPPLQLPETITLAVNAGFDGSFREGLWMPVYIRVSNEGDDVEGRLVVRPETSPNAVSNTYSLPISLPKGARKAVFLYINAEGFANQLRVELIENGGVVVAAQPANVRSLQSRDQLHVVVTQSASGVVDLTGVHDGSYSGFQANWRVENIPDQSSALTAVNMMLFSDIDSGQLSSGQKQAITDWVAQGGHLLVTGGTNWQSTAAGLTDLLPLTPQDSTSLENLTPIANWMHFGGENALSQAAVIATGALQPDARVLVKAGNDLPLVVRRTFGSGTVDYLAADPNALPLRGWGGLTELWITLATTVGSRPSWSFGVNDWGLASDSINVLPGVDLLPDILPLCGFLALYIGLIGPLNYLVLNRINRRELAWMTIPLFIVVFSALAWAVGFNLRGNEVTISRLSVVESWPDAPHARVQQLVGLLSPRRAQYSLSVTDSSFLWPLPRNNQPTGLFGGNLQLNADIQQSDVFRAANFPVDASYIAPFQASTTIVKPDIGGQATLFYDRGSGLQVMRGSVRNNTDQTLVDPVILVRGQALHLEKPLEPGAVTPFELTLPGDGLPSAVPLAFEPGVFRSIYFRSYNYQNAYPQTVKDILGDQLADRDYYFYPGATISREQQEFYRRRLFLASFISDPYNILTGRGNHAYLAAWSDQTPLGIELEGGTWKSLDSTLYLVQLEVEITPPTGQITISSDQFTWMVQNQATLDAAAPVEIALQPGDDVAFRFIPLPEAVLRQVNELTVIVDRGQTTTRSLPLYLWDWDKAAWESLRITGSNQLAIRNPKRFLGPENTVQVRIVADEIGGYPRFDNLSIEQRGEF